MIERSAVALPDDAQQRFIESMAMALEISGLPRMAGRIAAWLLICDPAEQTAADLEAAIGASKGSISTLTRLLIRMGIVEQVAVPGGRRQTYRARRDGLRALEADTIAQFHQMRQVIETGRPLVVEQPAELQARLLEWCDFYAFLETELEEVFRRWRARYAAGTVAS